MNFTTVPARQFIFDYNSKVYGLHPISMMDQYFDGKSDLFSYNVVKSHIFQLFFEKSDRRRVKTFLKGHFINLLSVPVNKKNADNFCEIVT